MEKFAFVIHPIDMKDVEKFEKGAKGRPPHLVLKVLEWAPPFEIGRIEGVRSKQGEEACGWFIACPFVPEQFLKLDQKVITDKIIKAGKVAQKLGAKVVGLGAFTSIVGDAGITVDKNLDIAVTTGNSYTIYSAIEGTKRAAKLMGIDLEEAKTAVVGATGSIGAVCAQILARSVPTLALIARRQEKLEELAADIRGDSPETEVSISSNVASAVSDSDVIVTVTSALDTVIDPCDIKPGAVVCDVARPRDVSAQVAKVRDDVLVIDGGVVKVPGKVSFGYDFGFPSGMAYACMSETMILALEGKYESYSLGKDLELDKVLQIGKLAKKHGFSLAGLRSFERAVTPEEINKVRKSAQKKLAKDENEASQGKVSPKPLPGTNYSY